MTSLETNRQSIFGHSLRPDLFRVACRDAGQALELNIRPGYDHSYFFISSFMENHLRHHAAALGADATRSTSFSSQSLC
jgi:S-formylglutathione hydrolase FrmB